MHNFKELTVWKRSQEFVKDVYLKTKGFPDEEKYGLISQLRRAAISMPSNIAEGSGRTDKGFVQFLRVSLSSAFEVETQLILSKDLGYLSHLNFKVLSQDVQEIQRMIYGLIDRLK